MAMYTVQKLGRGMYGHWFGYRVHRFATLAEAREYFDRFASDQRDVLSNGIRIDLRSPDGRRLVTVGGCLSSPTAIRECI
jgi:hypothetical protein